MNRRVLNACQTICRIINAKISEISSGFRQKRVETSICSGRKGGEGRGAVNCLVYSILKFVDLYMACEDIKIVDRNSHLN